jgi:hypothetical protein
MAIDSILANASAKVAGAIRSAAQSTGASFEYLLTAARIESNLNPAAQAPTSSAKGLYQFIDQTWLATLKTSGAAHGYGQYADAITQTPDGRFEVADPNLRAAIMKLRSDPAVSATMAGAFTQTNAAQLASTIGRQPSEGELYIAHFLGSDGASKLINVAATQPGANAAAMFPQAAAANPSIFHNRFGLPRSAGEVYSTLTGRFEVARAVNFAPDLRASTAVPAASPDTAGVTQAFAQANDNAPPPPKSAVEAVPIPAPAQGPRPLFQTMFTDRGNRPVTQTVSNLWTPAKTDAPAAAEPSRLLNLFTDAPPAPRKAPGGKI